jgi:hypothetical protein
MFGFEEARTRKQYIVSVETKRGEIDSDALSLMR